MESSIARGRVEVLAAMSMECHIMLPLVEAMETCTLERRYRRAVLELRLCQSSLDYQDGRWGLMPADVPILYDLMNINISNQIMWLSVAEQSSRWNVNPAKAET